MRNMLRVVLLVLALAANFREDLLNLVESKYTITAHFASAFEPDPQHARLPIQIRGRAFTCFLPWPVVSSENDTDHLVKGQLRDEVAFFLTSSLEGTSLIMDRGEWWTYELKIGSYLRQFHFDRIGLMKTQDDPTPNQIMLGMWREKRRSYPDQLFSLETLPTFISVVGYVARFSHPQKTRHKHGFILDWSIRVGKQVLSLHYKVDDYFFLLKEPVEAPLFREPFKVLERKEPLLLEAIQVIYRHFFVCQDCRFTGLIAARDTLVLKTSGGPLSVLVLRVWDDKLLELDRELPVKSVDGMSVMDSIGGRYRYKEIRHPLLVTGRVVIGQGTNFGAEIEKSILLSPMNILEKSNFYRREASPVALIEVEKIVSPSVLVLARSVSEYKQLAVPIFSHYYAVQEIRDFPELAEMECPSTISLGSPFLQQHFDSDCLRISHPDGFLMTFGVLFPYVGRPSFHGFTIELYSGRDLVAFYLLGWKNNTDNTFTVTSRPGEKQTNSRGFFDDPYSSLYLALRNHTLVLGKGPKVGDLTKFKSRFSANITRVAFRSAFTVMIKNVQIRPVPTEVDAALLFAKSLPSVVDKATFTEELIDGATCEITLQPREASVMYVCGNDDVTFLKSVTEYSTCKYAAVVSTPAMCPGSDAEDTDEVQNIDCVLSP